MRLRTYISLQGEGFNPREFQAQGGEAVGGQVRRRKQVIASPDDDAEYWVSAVVFGQPESIGDELKGVLAGVTPLLSAIPRREALKAYAHVVVEFEAGDEPPGMFFSGEVIRLLHEAGAELDIDAVPRIRAVG